MDSDLNNLKNIFINEIKYTVDVHKLRDILRKISNINEIFVYQLNSTQLNRLSNEFIEYNNR